MRRSTSTTTVSSSSHHTSTNTTLSIPPPTNNMSNPGNVIGGHKANLNNPNTSDEAKQHSKEVLQEIENGGAVPTSSSSSGNGDKNPNNVAGGLKATLSNPNVSDEAKESAKERLEDM
ncbi:conidiation 6 [Pyrenophora seminiperda CCB06]|uniref:Conidiation 6 n=1 Tax=Pyrenophora seminiperda CCB06 TaxID=1302712 RepID=A0A3M7M8G3_9PLEO|nr:conidiation 6 [Pyrenophora seminiperda CCB06]